MVSAGAASIFIGVIAAIEGKAAVLATAGILVTAMSLAVPAAPVVATMNAALYKKMEAIQSISVLDPTVMFALISIFCLAARTLLLRRSRQAIVQNRSLLLWFIALCVAMSIGVIGPYSTRYGIDKLLRFVGLTAPLVFLASTWDRDDIEEYLGLLLLASSIVALLEVLPVDIRDAYGDASAPNYLARGRWSGYGAIIALTLRYRVADNGLGRFAAVCAWAVCAYVLLAVGGRGPIIAYVLSPIITQLFAPTFDGEAVSHRRIKGIIMGLIGFVLVACVILWAPIDAFSLAQAKFRLLMSSERGPSTLTRARFFREALIILVEHPVAGVGLGGFALKGLQIATREYPHNLLLEILSETGIVGFVPLVGLLVTSLRGYRRKMRSSSRRERVLLESALTLLLFAFINAMVSGDINDNRMLFVMLPIVHSLVRQQTSDSLVGEAR